jgi:acetate kinase
MSILRLLALNVGSSSIKAATFDLHRCKGGATTLVETSRIESSTEDGPPSLDATLGRASADTPDIVVHRVVHGGDRTHGCELGPEVLQALEALAPLAPLHQPAALSAIRAARRRWPAARHGAAFDTSFHSALAPWSRRLPIPADWDRMGLRRYGFHGLAFASALRIVAGYDRDILQARAVLVHLGGGCSLCALDRGLSRDTTMAVTPLGGVEGPRRSGDLDPGLVLYLLRRGLTSDEIETRLSHEGGLTGVAGKGDMQKLLEAADPAAVLAVDQFVMRIAQSVASMAVAVGGFEHLAFSGGIGHRASAVRERVVAQLRWLGLELDVERNRRGEPRIDAGGRCAIWNIEVDEQRVLAESALLWL